VPATLRLASLSMTRVAPFEINGVLYPRSPVVIAVAHAGRHYPQGLIDMARVPIKALQGLEDRHADALIGTAAREGATTIVVSLARAAIDMNRDPREIDPAMVEDVRPGRALLQTQKVRGGLGLIPRRLASCGELWHRRLSEDELDRRIAEVHHPYHQAVADALEAARAVYGGAILIDCHSMPTLPARSGARPQIVLGDRFGKSASPAIIHDALEVLKRHDIPHGRNQPYAGGYTLERHGQPARGVHAVQIEFDRALYMGDDGEPVVEAVSRCSRLLADLSLTLGGRLGRDTLIAAE